MKVAAAIYLFLSICILVVFLNACEPEYSPDVLMHYAMSCTPHIGPWNSGIKRCENAETVCYVTADGLSCHWKGGNK